MKAPVDYPIEDAAHDTDFSVDELIYAVYLDRMSSASCTDTSSIAEHGFIPMPPDSYPVIRKKPAQPFSELTHSLLTFEASGRRLESAGMLSRLASGLSRQ